MKQARREFFRGADKHRLTVNMRLNPAARQRALRLRDGKRQPTLCRCLNHGLGQRMRGTLLNRRCQRQQRLFAAAKRIDCRHLRFPHRQGAGFIKSDLRDTPKLLQRRAAFDQRPAARRRRKAGGNGRRRGDHQRTRAANQQQRQPFVDPLRPCRVQQQRR